MTKSRMLLSVAEAAQAFRVTPRTLRNWLADGLPCHGEGKKRQIDLAEAVRWRLDRERAVLERKAVDIPPRHESEARLQAARAKIAELELAKLEGELIPMDLHIQHVELICDRLRAKMLNLPGRWAPLLLGKRTIHEIVAVLEEAVTDAMWALRSVADELEEEYADPDRVDL